MNKRNRLARQTAEGESGREKQGWTSEAQERELRIVGEKSLKTPVQCVVGIIKRQQILNMLKNRNEI